MCSDVGKPDLHVSAEQIPHALHVLDRFHIMRNTHLAIDEVRRQEVAQVRRDEYEPALTPSRWCLRKRPEKLTAENSCETVIKESLRPGLSPDMRLSRKNGLDKFLRGRSIAIMGNVDSHTLKVQKLFVQHQGQLRAFVLAVWPDFVRADDVLQEAFLTVTSKASDFREGSNFLAWARAITQRKVYEEQRRVRRFTMSPGLLDSLAAACPEGWAEDRRLAMLAECLKSLPPRAQELVRLRYQKEHSPPEIATILGRTLNSVNVALAKARVALRDCVNRRLDPADLPAAGT